MLLIPIDHFHKTLMSQQATTRSTKQCAMQKVIAPRVGFTFLANKNNNGQFELHKSFWLKISNKISVAYMSRKQGLWQLTSKNLQSFRIAAISTATVSRKTCEFYF